ncbi:MAG: LapA family protein [candidate division Zixibacteria bacterium]|nr:LapA family protein [candidate division Zixibacteria bacterium]
MWIIRYAVAAVLIVGLLGFSIQNTSQKVQITIAAKHFYDVPLIFVIYIAFCIGLLFWFAISIIQYFKMVSQLSEQKKRNRILTQEITTLRNLPLEEPDEKAESGQDQEEGS